MKDVSKIYNISRDNTKTALDHINMVFPTGSITAILGANGAGKTTLLKCIAGITQYKGKIEFSPSGTVAFCTEQGSFFPSLTARENGEICQKLYHKFDFLLFCELLKQFDVPQDVKASKLSRGQKSALEISMGICKNADYFLLDEPFIGVDIFARRNFLRSIIENKREEQTVIVTTHIVDELQNLLDFAYIIHAKTLKYINFSEENPDLAAAMREIYKENMIIV